VAGCGGHADLARYRHWWPVIGNLHTAGMEIARRICQFEMVFAQRGNVESFSFASISSACPLL
jgi:hypothetical protein